MKKNDIILINPFQRIAGDNEGVASAPLGLMYIASVLEHDGHSVAIIDARLRRLNVSNTIQAVMDKNPDPVLIGIYVNSFNQKACVELVRGMRRVFPDAAIVLGGPVPTVIPERILNDVAPDYLVRGEGEFSVRDLVRKLKDNPHQVVRNVAGVIPKDKSVSIDSKAARITNLDSLPFPAYHLLGDINRYFSRSRGLPFAVMITSRGCQYDCDFCSKDVFGNNVTRRSVGNVINEIDELIKRYRVKQINFVDDNITNNRNYFETLLDGILARDYGIWFSAPSGIRSEILDEGLLKKMRRAGFYSLAFGIETADQDLLNMHCKSLNIGLMEEKIRLAKKSGFIVSGFFIIGLIGETENSFKKTMEFIKRTKIDMANFVIALPFPGTRMLSTIKEKGRLLFDVEGGLDNGYYSGQCFFSFPGLNPDDIVRRYRTAYRQFYNISRILSMLRQCKSSAEYKWFFKNGFSVAMNMFKKNN